DQDADSGTFEAHAPSDHGANGDAEGDNGGKRRRRRRRRGRRGGSGEAVGGDDANGHADASAHDEHEDDAAETLPDNMQGEPPLAASEDGERRRRRRGRRGGRRNRREHEGEARPAAETQAESGWQDWAEHPQSDDAAPSTAAPPAAETFDAVEPAREPRHEPTGFEPAAPEPQPARPSPVVTPIETTPEVEQVPVRRRSTIREPAPVVGGSFDSAATATAASPPDPVPEIAPAPTASESEAAPAENKPRRAGWWSRKILGKD
ncbi:MAG: hypothetical protein J0H17_19135, partial [Rhizobiales bacterium]|nr:hypothetical protein [Hyphomicrobiales bacterium]